MKQIIEVGLAVLMVVLAVGTRGAEACMTGTASGQYVFHGQSFTMSRAYACPKLEASGRAGSGLILVLSDASPPAEVRLDDPTAPYSMRLLAQQGALHAYFLVLDAEGQIMAGVSTDATSSLGWQKLERGAWSQDVLEGRLSGTSADGESLDVKFSVAKAPQRASVSLPEDGGEPGAAYLRYIEASGKGDLDLLKPMMSHALLARLEQGMKSVPEDQLRYLIEEKFKPHVTNALRLVGGTLDGDRAVLKAEDVSRDGRRRIGTIPMAREDGQWKVDVGHTWFITLEKASGDSRPGP